MNKGTDEHYVTVVLLHNTIHHYQAVHQIQNPTQVVAENSLTENYRTRNTHLIYLIMLK